jgi:hypothetical protein
MKTGAGGPIMAEEPEGFVLQLVRERRGENAALRESVEEHSELLKGAECPSRYSWASV